MTENPYRLARDIRGIGFKTADAIAMKLGVEKIAMVRVRAGLQPTPPARGLNVLLLVFLAGMTTGAFLFASAGQPVQTASENGKASRPASHYVNVSYAGGVIVHAFLLHYANQDWNAGPDCAISRACLRFVASGAFLRGFLG